jgi:hypothetical protein
MNRVVPHAFGRSSLAKYPLDVDHGGAEQEGGAWSDDLRLFATGWLAGLVFFATFLA